MKKISPSTKYLLKGLIPYTEANMRLAFIPSTFFFELEKKSRVKERTLRSAYYRALSAGLVEINEDGIPKLTAKGLSKTKLYKPSKIGKEAYLLVMFDIPETERVKRNHLRALLRELSFTKIQHSVWASKYDHREYLSAEISEFGLNDYVAIYEAVKLSPKIY